MRSASEFVGAVRRHMHCRAIMMVALPMLGIMCGGACARMAAQASSAVPGATASGDESVEQKVERLTAAVSQVEGQMEASREVLDDLQGELAALRLQMALGPAGASAPPAPSLDELAERQTIAESQIAIHEQTKVESESKFPLKLSGLVLFNGFLNTHAVDNSAAPAYLVPGAIGSPGSTGLSVRQTVLGLDARGPHLFGASSRADVRVDFFATAAASDYAESGVLRLRTAHASLNWERSNWGRTEAFVDLDRSLLEPNAPTSLLAMGQPELSWAGNLWTWNPQAGVSHDFGLGHLARLRTEAALIDVGDPGVGTASGSPVSSAERSRWPGTEARVAIFGGENGDGESGPEFGVGGYFSPHRSADGGRFDAWAGSMDLRLPFEKHFELTGGAYRGAALGGLGGGGYVDYYEQYLYKTSGARALDDVGGWAQFKARTAGRLEFNAGYGIDNPFAKEVHEGSDYGDGPAYQGLARNRSSFGNVIWTPSTYLLFSLEYKRLWTAYPTGAPAAGDVIGLGAGYRF